MTQTRLKKLNEMVDEVRASSRGMLLNGNIVAELVMERVPLCWYSDGENPWKEVKDLILARLWEAGANI